MMDGEPTVGNEAVTEDMTRAFLMGLSGPSRPQSTRTPHDKTSGCLPGKFLRGSVRTEGPDRNATGYSKRPRCLSDFLRTPPKPQPSRCPAGRRAYQPASPLDA